jgi:hypothetical protein
MNELLERLGKAVYETYDAVHALKENPATIGKYFEDLNPQERFIVSGPYTFVTDLIIQLFALIDDLDSSLFALGRRIDVLEKKEREKNNDTTN